MLDPAGNIYVTDWGTSYIRKFTVGGSINTIAGNGASVYSGDGGAATIAMIADPEAVTVDAAGDLFIADFGNNVVREVNHATGIITTVAGNGFGGLSGDNGPATAAQLNRPSALALDSAGDLFIADRYNNRIREVNLNTGIITTFAGQTNNFFGAYGGDNGLATAAYRTAPPASRSIRPATCLSPTKATTASAK